MSLKGKLISHSSCTVSQDVSYGQELINVSAKNSQRGATLGRKGLFFITIRTSIALSSVEGI